MIKDLIVVGNDRTDMTYRRGNELWSNYLKRTARPGMLRVINLLNEWFKDFPEEGKKNMYTRFHREKKNDIHPHFFELYCSTLLSKQGHSVEVTDLNQSENFPDFRATLANGFSLYLESKVHFPHDEYTLQQKRLSQLIEYINTHMSCPNFFIGLSVERYGNTEPPYRKIRHYLNKSLNDLDADEIYLASRKSSSFRLPETTYNDKGWCLRFTFSTKSPEGREDSTHRVIGIWSGGLFNISNAKPLTDDLVKKAKAKRYDYNLMGDNPFIIAVNSIDWLSYDDLNFIDAVYGRDSLLFGKRGEQRRHRVSAVLGTGTLTPTNIVNADAVLYHNPHATHPLPPDLWQGHQWIDGALRKSRPAWEILGVSPGYPEN